LWQPKGGYQTTHFGRLFSLFFAAKHQLLTAGFPQKHGRRRFGDKKTAKPVPVLPLFSAVLVTSN
jgi:hypothetical protein